MHTQLGSRTGSPVGEFEYPITLITGILILDVYTQRRLPRQETIVMAKKTASKKKATKKKAKKKAKKKR
jgi:hypothetical protein